jgi:hypothetical protein
MKNQPLNLILTLLLISFGCSKNQNHPKSYRCNNIVSLLGVNDSIPIISFDYSNDPIRLIEENPDIFNASTCGDFIELGLKLPDASVVMVTYRYICDTNVIICGPPWIEINLTNKDVLRLGNKEIRLDTLQSIILEEKAVFRWDEIHFGWSSGASAKRIQQVFNEIITAQVAYASKSSRLINGKYICSLDSVEIEKLRDYGNMEIYLEIGESWITPDIDYDLIKME